MDAFFDGEKYPLRFKVVEWDDDGTVVTAVGCRKLSEALKNVSCKRLTIFSLNSLRDSVQVPTKCDVRQIRGTEYKKRYGK